MVSIMIHQNHSNSKIFLHIDFINALLNEASDRKMLSKRLTPKV